MASYGRRQSTRTSRTARPSNYYAKPFSYRSSLGGPPEDLDDVDPPGFFPAIQYFTDATASLPREVQKHLTLLKETEGKQYAPSEVLTRLLDAVDRIPDPPASTASLPQPGFLGFSTTNSATASTSGSVIDGVQPSSTVAPTSADISMSSNPDPYSAEREALYSRLQGTLREMVMILDEKNMVLSSANETLARQVARLDDVMPYIDDEISEETRQGSNTHWALPHMKDLRRAQGSGRSTRDLQAAANLAAAAAVVHEGDIAATRSEARREAMMAKRGRHMIVDSDFDDRHVVKRPGKAKREKDGQTDGKGALPVPKKRKVEKNPERALSAALNGRLAREESRERAPGGRGKKTAASQSTVAKKRGAASSPSLAAASPTRGTFSTIPKEHSPAPAMQRAPSSRGRQNSTQSAANDNSRNRPSSSASNKRGLGVVNSASESKKAGPVQSRFAGDNGIDHAEMHDSDTVNAPEQPQNGNGHTAIAMQRSNSQAFKREETEPGDDANIGTDTRQMRGRTSKPATPVNVSDDAKEQTKEVGQVSRVRNARSVNTALAASSPVRSPQQSPKRPQRKVASANARKSSVDEELAKEGSDHEGTAIDGDGEEENDENEPRYCVCGGVSYGDMIACDNDQCPHEWFHLECVGLSRPPTSRQWYCSDDCRQVARSKR